MALLEVLRFPDPRLRTKAQPVNEVDGFIQKLAQNMLETMYSQKGIGLAATQVGVAVRLLVIDISNPDAPYDSDSGSNLECPTPMPLVVVNPKIVHKEGCTSYEEGCLSLPGFYETVQRFKTIQVKALDVYGNPLDLKLDGLLSICMQHEMDHLDGKVFIDRLSPMKSRRIQSRIGKYGYPPLDEVRGRKEKELEVGKES